MLFSTSSCSTIFVFDFVNCLSTEVDILKVKSTIKKEKKKKRNINYQLSTT